MLAFYSRCKLLAKKGEKYECEECGLVVIIEDPCGCEEVELICCEAPMKPAKTKAKTKSKAKAKAKPRTKKN
jgi:hypothetical protein